jgi:hypothetical protein
MKLWTLMSVALALITTGQAQHMGMASSGTLPIPSPCVTMPGAATCASYKYPHNYAVADLNNLCTAMPFMAGCSVAKACAAAGAGPDNPTGSGAAMVSRSNPSVCRVFNQVATVCKLDTGMSRMSGERGCRPAWEYSCCSLSQSGLLNTSI